MTYFSVRTNTSKHFQTCVHPDMNHLYFSHMDTCKHTQPVKGNSKLVSTSHIPPVSQPAALFVDQSPDNKSFYRLALLQLSSSFNATFSQTLSHSSSYHKHLSGLRKSSLFLVILTQSPKKAFSAAVLFSFFFRPWITCSFSFRHLLYHTTITSDLFFPYTPH